MGQKVADETLVVAFRPQEFFEVERTHFIVRLIADAVAFDSLVVQAKHESAANHIESPILLQEFERGCNFGKFLQLIKKEQGFALDEAVRRVYETYVPHNVIRGVTVFDDAFVLRVFHEIDFDRRVVVCPSESANRLRFADLSRPFHYQGVLCRILFPCGKKRVDFSAEIHACSRSDSIACLTGIIHFYERVFTKNRTFMSEFLVLEHTFMSEF